jgi:hypothetical protein
MEKLRKNDLEQNSVTQGYRYTNRIANHIVITFLIALILFLILFLLFTS